MGSSVARILILNKFIFSLKNLGCIVPAFYAIILNYFGVAGFEPTHGGTKNRCLTTWPHPNLF